MADMIDRISAHLGIDIAKATFEVAPLTADGKIKPEGV
jgi:predicted aspartyl protease